MNVGLSHFGLILVDMVEAFYEDTAKVLLIYVQYLAESEVRQTRTVYLLSYDALLYIVDREFLTGCYHEDSVDCLDVLDVEIFVQAAKLQIAAHAKTI